MAHKLVWVWDGDPRTQPKAVPFSRYYQDRALLADRPSVHKLECFETEQEALFARRDTLARLTVENEEAILRLRPHVTLPLDVAETLADYLAPDGASMSTETADSIVDLIDRQVASIIGNRRPL